MMVLNTKRQLEVFIDDEDFEKANLGKGLFVKENGFVIISKRTGPRRGSHTYLHKIIINCPPGLQVDHINGNRLDNRKCNLRICTHNQNQFNKKPRRKRYNLSPFKGITRSHTSSERWHAKIGFKNKIISLGSFATAEEAARRYDEEAKILYGEFAYLNFP